MEQSICKVYHHSNGDITSLFSSIITEVDLRSFMTDNDTWTFKNGCFYILPKSFSIVA